MGTLVAGEDGPETVSKERENGNNIRACPLYQ